MDSSLGLVDIVLGLVSRPSLIGTNTSMFVSHVFFYGRIEFPVCHKMKEATDKVISSSLPGTPCTFYMTPGFYSYINLSCVSDGLRQYN